MPVKVTICNDLPENSVFKCG